MVWNHLAAHPFKTAWLLELQVVPSLKLTVRHLKMTPWKFGDSYWKPSFLGAMLVSGCVILEILVLFVNHLWFFQQFGRLGHWKTSPWFGIHVLLVAIGSWGRVSPNALKMHWQIISSTQSLQLFTAKKHERSWKLNVKCIKHLYEQSIIIIPWNMYHWTIRRWGIKTTRLYQVSWLGYLYKSAILGIPWKYVSTSGSFWMMINP